MKQRRNPQATSDQTIEKKIIPKIIGNSFSSLNEAINHLKNKMPDYKFDKNGKPFYVYTLGNKKLIKKIPKYIKRNYKVSI